MTHHHATNPQFRLHHHNRFHHHPHLSPMTPLLNTYPDNSTFEIAQQVPMNSATLDKQEIDHIHR
jgi:hypothetical protein